MVVSYSVSTSNHNVPCRPPSYRPVVSYSVSTSNHNIIANGLINEVLYLILFLHQTTTWRKSYWFWWCCILFCFYIKPQPAGWSWFLSVSCILFCFYIKPQRTAIDALKNSVLQLFLIFKNILTTVTKSI